MKRYSSDTFTLHIGQMVSDRNKILKHLQLKMERLIVFYLYL